MNKAEASPGYLTVLPFAGLLALVIWLPIPWGSNVPWAVPLLGVWIAALLGSCGLLLTAGQIAVPRAVWGNRWILLIWMLWLGWVALQLVPGLTWAEAGTIERPVISLVPEITYQHLLESLSYFGLYLLVLLTATNRKRLQLLAMTIVFAGLMQAVYGSLMTLSGAEYGFFAKKTAYLGTATGTFVNRNHLAGYLEICAAMGIGLILADLRGGTRGNWRVWLRDITELMFSRKLRLRIFLAIMVIALVLTRSRMGNVAFFSSLMLCGSLYVLLRERRLFLKSVILFASFLVVDLMIVSEWFGLDKVIERVEQTEAVSEARTHIFPELTRGIENYWQTGSGLGTFGLAILPYRAVYPKQYWDHAHNDYAEFVIEAGVPGAFLLLCMALVTVVHAIRVIAIQRSQLKAGIALAALMSLVAIAIHSTVDFNLQIPANAATLIIVMAMVNSCSDRRRKSQKALDNQLPENST